MLKTWVFFTCGGIFTGIYTNAVRNYRLFRSPFMLLNSTAVGFTIGYFMHQYEETAEERTQLLLTKYAHAPKEWVEVKRDE